MRRASCLLATCLLFACGSDETTAPGTTPETGTTALFDLTADLAQPSAFYDFPYPSDLRLTDRGTPDLTGFPYPSFLATFDGLRKAAMDHEGFPVVPVAYFRFSGPLAPLDENDVIAADAESPILLIDVDDKSPTFGALLPTVATTPPVDPYVVENMLAVAARPGIVLQPNHRYAFVVRRSLGDAAGKPLAVPTSLADMRENRVPAGAKGEEAKELYLMFWYSLLIAGIPAQEIAAATVFTTGDVVEQLASLSTALMAKHTITIDDLHVDPDDGDAHDRYCELVGQVTFPQFQRGTPPFDTEGLFDYADGGLPAKQRDEVAPITITIPREAMPAAGYPLVIYFHGSGGTSTAIADRGTWRPVDDASVCPDGHTDMWEGVSGCNTKGEGPGHVVAPFGFAMAQSALPVNPERLPGAAETEYLNFDNLAAGRDLFQQGAIEQRMFIEALGKLVIPPETVAACAGMSLPAGETGYKLDVSRLFSQGQSMGGQYTNLVSAIEPRIHGAVPTGAGGFWSHFILHTPLIANVGSVVGTVLLGTQAKLTFMHPALMVFETAWEPVDPMVYMPRLARRPLEGHPVRSIYEPAGLGDSYFPTETYDAMALAYGHQQAGAEIWPTMQDALALGGLDGLASYPLTDNLTSEDGTPYTGVVVQYEGDGVYDPHALYTQLDAVKYQYGCFLSTLLKNGKATVPAPAALGTPCPE